MSDEMRFYLGFEDEADAAAAEAIASDVNELGGQAELLRDQQFLPVPVLLAIVIPPGVGLLASVFHRIFERSQPGVLIDARGEDLKVTALKGTPFGTVVILAGEDDKVERSDIAEADVGEYISKALSALAGGKSASEAAAEAESAVKDGEKT